MLIDPDKMARLIAHIKANASEEDDDYPPHEYDEFNPHEHYGGNADDCYNGGIDAGREELADELLGILNG